jgi:acetyl esterase/lipase
MQPFSEDRSVLSRSAQVADSVVRYGELDEQIADIRHGAAGSKRPLVILIHGGFWRPSIDRTHAGPMSVAIAQAGWTVATMEYRRISGQPDVTMADVILATTELPVRIQQHNGNVFVIGHSAGGHLALCAAAKSESSALIGALALGPVADLAYADLQQLGDRAAQMFLGCPASARYDLDPCLLPTSRANVTIVHGLEDAIAPPAMSDNYKSRHPTTRLVKLRDCGHFALIDPLSVAWPSVLAELQTLL